MISQQLLSVLRCPVEHGPLRNVEAAVVARLNERIAAGSLVSRGGQPVQRPLTGGLLNESGTILYPVVDGIANLLVDEAIAMDQLVSMESESP